MTLQEEAQIDGNFLRIHKQEALLIGLTIVFLALVVGFFAGVAYRENALFSHEDVVVWNQSRLSDWSQGNIIFSPDGTMAAAWRGLFYRVVDFEQDTILLDSVDETLGFIEYMRFDEDGVLWRKQPQLQEETRVSLINPYR